MVYAQLCLSPSAHHYSGTIFRFDRPKLQNIQVSYYSNTNEWHNFSIASRVGCGASWKTYHTKVQYSTKNQTYYDNNQLKFMFSKKATKIDEIFTLLIWHYVVCVKTTVKILSILVAFLENTNFMAYFSKKWFYNHFWICTEKSQRWLPQYGQSQSE